MSRTSSPSAWPSAMSGVKSLKRTPGFGKSGMSRSLLATRSLIWLTPSPRGGWNARSGADRADGTADAGPSAAPRLRGALGLVARPGLGVLVHRTRHPLGRGRRRVRGRLGRAGGVGADDGRFGDAVGSRRALLDAVARDVRVELADRGLVAPQVDEQRRGDEDRRVGAHGDADEQRERQVEQRAGPEQGEADEEHGGDRQERDDGRVDRADQGLVDREVGRRGVRHALGAEGLRGVLADLVEDDDGVIARVAEDREEADHRGRGDLEPEQRIDADGDDEVVQQRHEARDGHLPGAEVERHDDRHEDEEDDESSDRLLADRLSPAGPDERGADRALVDTELLRERRTGLVGAVGRRLGLHADGVLADDRRDDVARDARGGDRGLRLLLVALAVGDALDAELGAAAELDAEVEAPDEDADEREGDEDGREGVPGLLALDEVDRALARVEVVSDLGEVDHAWAFPSAMRAEPTVAGGRLAPGAPNWPRPR